MSQELKHHVCKYQDHMNKREFIFERRKNINYDVGIRIDTEKKTKKKNLTKTILVTAT